MFGLGFLINSEEHKLKSYQMLNNACDIYIYIHIYAYTRTSKLLFRDAYGPGSSRVRGLLGLRVSHGFHYHPPRLQLQVPPSLATPSLLLLSNSAKVQRVVWARRGFAGECMAHLRFTGRLSAC